MGSLEAHIVADLWDLEDWGFDTALDLLQNELGAGGLTVRLDPPPGAQLRPRAADAPRLYRHSGGLWFRPQAERYQQTRLKPICAPEMRSRNPFARLARCCADRDFPLRVWLEGCRNPLAAARQPEMAVKDAFGHVSPEWLCPHNPDVEAYLHALVGDLCGGYTLEAIILASPAFQPTEAILTGVEAGMVLGPAERFLFGLCFCESSQQRAAGADVEVRAVATLARQLLLERFKGAPGEQGALDRLLTRYPVLEHLDRWRRREAGRLIGALAQRADTAVILHEQVPCAEDSFPCDRLLVTCREARPEGVEQGAGRGLDRVKTVGRLELFFDLRPGSIDDSQALVSAVTRAAELGVTHMSLGHLSLWTEGHFDWIKKALRQARRILRAP